MITVDDWGRVTDVRSAPGGEVLLNCFGPEAGSVLEVRREEDEVELSARQGPLTLNLRQSFAAGWTTRIMITGGADDPEEAEPVTVEWQLGPGVTPWLCCAGREGWLTLLSASEGSLLAARVTSGSLADVTGEGIVVSASAQPLTLQWDWYDSPAELISRLPDGLPARGTYRDQGAAVLKGDLDTAISAGSRVVVDESDPTEILLHGQSRSPQPLAFHSARGTTTTTIRWAVTDADLLAGSVHQLLQGPRTPAGLVRIDDLPAALVLQHVLQEAPADDTTANEALDLFTARVTPIDADDVGAEVAPWWCSYLVGEHQRLGDPELLERAVAFLDRSVAVAERDQSLPAGFGFAAARLAVALVLGGSATPGRALDPLAALVTSCPAPTDPAWWEARLITGRLVGSPDRLPIKPLIGFGRVLGAGLPGSSVRSLPAARVAQLVSVLRLVPDGLSRDLARDWGVETAELADRASATLCADLEDQPPGPAHAWLAVS